MNLNIPIKTSGSTLTADEFNQIPEAINSKADESLLQNYLSISGATATYQAKGNYLFSADVVGKYLTTGTTISYNSLTDKPTIPSLNGYATESFVNGKGFLTGVTWTNVVAKPTFSTVATSGNYSDLSNKPDLTQKADLINGEIPMENLPDLILSDWLQIKPDTAFPNNRSKDILTVNETKLLSFAASNGWGSGTGTTLPIPPAPTNAVVNDVANTFAVTPPNGYANAQLQTSVNSGSTWTDNINLNEPYFVGNVNLPASSVITRVKASAGYYQTGLGLSNATAFTTSTSGSTLTPVTEWTVNGNTSSGNTINIPFTNATSTKYLLSGQEGHFEYTGAARLGFFRDNIIYCGIYVNSYNSKVGVERRVYPANQNQIADQYVDFGGQQPRLRMRADANYFYPEFSTNGGVTWQSVTTDPTPIPRPSGDLQLVAGQGNNAGADLASNILGSNLVIK